MWGSGLVEVGEVMGGWKSLGMKVAGFVFNLYMSGNAGKARFEKKTNNACEPA